MHSSTDISYIPHVNTNTLLAQYEPAAYRRVINNPDSMVLLNCDHGSNRIPESLGSLGLDKELLQEHIAWDIGTEELTERLVRNLNVNGIFCNYSRLVVDCNRDLFDPSAFIEVSDSIPIPGNQNLHVLDKSARAEALYYSYHRAIRNELDTRTTAERTPVLIAIHSFTPQLRGQKSRPWHAGILWDKDPRIAVPLINILRAELGDKVGDNEPYSGKHFADYTMDHQAEAKGIAHVSIEVRQDLLQSETGMNEWTERLSTALEQILANEDLFIPLSVWQERGQAGRKIRQSR